MKAHGSAPSATASIERSIADTCPFVLHYKHTHSRSSLWALGTLRTLEALGPRRALRSCWTLRPLWSLRTLWTSWTRTALRPLWTLWSSRTRFALRTLRPRGALVEVANVRASKLAG